MYRTIFDPAFLPWLRFNVSQMETIVYILKTIQRIGGLLQKPVSNEKVQHERQAEQVKVVENGRSYNKRFHMGILMSYCT